MVFFIIPIIVLPLAIFEQNETVLLSITCIYFVKDLLKIDFAPRETLHQNMVIGNNEIIQLTMEFLCWYLCYLAINGGVKCKTL